MPEAPPPGERGERGSVIPAHASSRRRFHRPANLALWVLPPATLLLLLASGVSVSNSPLAHWWIDVAFLAATAGTSYLLFFSVTSLAKRSIERDAP